MIYILIKLNINTIQFIFVQLIYKKTRIALKIIKLTLTWSFSSFNFTQINSKSIKSLNY